MTLSKKFFPLLLLFFFFFIFPLQHALNPKTCPSSYIDSIFNTCELFGVPIRFPFCGHPGFSLHCTDLNKTVLELPLCGTFLVEHIDYQKQQITINDPENCLVERLLTFDTSGSPFSSRFNVNYTFLTCPNKVVKPSWYPSISCLSNSSTSFFATSNLALANTLLPSCQIVKRVAVPVSWQFQETEFSDYLNYRGLLLEWDSPNCRACESDYLRCGFKNKVSLEVKCLDKKPAIAARTVRQEPRGVVVTRGLDQSTIESYKTVELGESRRLPGTNGGCNLFIRIC